MRSMFDAIAPRYDLLNRLLTFRLDVRWRRRTVEDLALPTGSAVLDLACGTGDLCRDLDRAGHHPIGLDLSWGMLAAARTTPAGAVDGVTCGFALRNLAALEPFFGELARVLRPGGRIALLEVDRPRNPLLRAGHSVYFGRVVPFIGGLLSDRTAYRYLPRSVVYLPTEPELLHQIMQAGFTEVTKTHLSGGIAQLLTATRNT